MGIPLNETSLRPADIVSPQWIKFFVYEWGRCWNELDFDKLLRMLTSDIVWDDDTIPGTLVGLVQVSQFLEHFKKHAPDGLQFNLIDGPYLIHGTPKAAIHWTCTRTVKDRRLVVHGVDFFEFRNHKLCGFRTFTERVRSARGFRPFARPA